VKTTRTLTSRSSGASPWDYRGLITNFARRDLKARFRGTVLGWLWSLVIPLATVLIYTAVFSVIFRSIPPDYGNGEQGNYAVWLLVGLITWSAFAVGVTQAIPSLLASGRLLQKIYIPSYVPVIGNALASTVQTIIEYIILFVILLVVGNFGITWLLMPLILALLLVFTTALGYTLGVLNVYARDVQQITTVVVQLLFFLSPVIYPLDRIPEEWHGVPVKAVMEFNPMAQFITMARDVLYGLTLPRWDSLAIVLVWTVALLVIARFTYLRKGQDIGENV